MLSRNKTNLIKAARYYGEEMTSTVLVLASTLRVNDFIIVPDHFHKLNSRQITSITTTLPSSPTSTEEYNIHFGYRDHGDFKTCVVSELDKVMVPEKSAVVGRAGNETYTIRVDALRENGYIVINERPGNIVDMSYAKCCCKKGPKIHITAIDILTGKMLEKLYYRWDVVTVPVVTKAEMLLVEVKDDGFLSLMRQDGNGGTKENVKIPLGEVGKKIEDDFVEGVLDKDVLVTVLTAMGEEAAIDVREVIGKVEEETWEMVEAEA